MNRILARATVLATTFLIAGIAAAAGPVNPPPSSCRFDEVYKCYNIGGWTYCRCVKRDIAIPGGNDLARLEGKPQHLASHGAGATQGTTSNG